MKILILGAGGTGGFFGGRLAAVHPDVTFLVRPKRAGQLAADGLIIETPTERIVQTVNTVSAEIVRPEYDLVILSCKAYDLDSSIAAIRPAMHASTVVLPLLNGIAHLDTLDHAFGASRVMGGSCQIAATLTSDGVVRSLSDLQTILWGAREGDVHQQALAHALGELFAKTAVSWKVSDDIMQDMWEKITFLSTLAGMTCLMRASIGDILATADGATIMRRYIDTSIAIASAEGFAPRQPIRQRFESVLGSVGSPMTASMLRDIEANNQVEADHIVGYMLQKARHHSIDDTLLSIAYAHLQAYQHRRAAKPS